MGEIKKVRTVCRGCHHLGRYKTNFRKNGPCEIDNINELMCELLGERGFLKRIVQNFITSTHKSPTITIVPYFIHSIVQE